MSTQTSELLAVLKRMRAYLMKCAPSESDPLGAQWGRLMDDSGRVIAKVEGNHD